MHIKNKIKELKPLFEESEQTRECADRFKRGRKDEESSPQGHLTKKAMTLTPPKSKVTLTSRFKPIAPKHIVTSQVADTQATKERALPKYLQPKPPRAEGANVLSSFGLQQAKVSLEEY